MVQGVLLDEFYCQVLYLVFLLEGQKINTTFSDVGRESIVFHTVGQGMAKNVIIAFIVVPTVLEIL